MVKSVLFSAIIAALTYSTDTDAFTAVSSTLYPPTTRSQTVLQATLDSNVAASSRRSFFTTIATATATAFLTPTPALAAADSPPTPEELSRIKTGYENIQYLLSHWEEETTVCRENGGECKRDADAVRRYLGLRSTKDPLFQIEKVFAKVKNMDGIDIDKLEDFFEATEDWNTAMNMSNSMAFISQFGEYNPGGGKDEVLKYLNESQKQVILAEKALKIILDTVQSASSM